jgi:GGDEF domain-containing protein
MIGHIKHKEDAPIDLPETQEQTGCQELSPANIHITYQLSIGYVVCDPAVDNPTMDEILSEADKKMYEVKITSGKRLRKNEHRFYRYHFKH